MYMPERAVPSVQPMTIDKYVVPCLVGVDIGCGMLTVRLKGKNKFTVLEFKATMKGIFTTSYQEKLSMNILWRIKI